MESMRCDSAEFIAKVDGIGELMPLYLIGTCILLVLNAFISAFPTDYGIPRINCKMGDVSSVVEKPMFWVRQKRLCQCGTLFSVLVLI
jgi:hypothetical protein